MILVNNQQSTLFSCNNGIRQDENLSHVLFSRYLNDLEDYLSSHGCEWVSTTTDNQDHPIDITVHMLCLLCADDTALLSTTAADLQHNLTMFYQYCNRWKLKINGSKTKILENVKEYKYLGIAFTKLNNFQISKNNLNQQATKAMYFVVSKSKDNYLSIECKRKLFDSMVLPLLLYGCEIWGYEKVDIFNSVQINVLRHHTC